jgi:uncharacterized membrane protein
MIRSKYSSLAGMLISLFLFFGLDRWLADQAKIARDNTDFRSYVLWITLIGFAIAALLYVLSWLTLFRSQRSTPISIIFIVVGLVVYLYPVLYLWSPVWAPWLPLPYLFSYDTPVAYTGVFITVLGFLHLSQP